VFKQKGGALKYDRQPTGKQKKNAQKKELEVSDGEMSPPPRIVFSNKESLK